MSNELVAAEQAVQKLTPVTLSLVKESSERSLSLKFPNKEGYGAADALYNEIHRVWKSGEEQRISFTGPLNAVLDKINAVFKGNLDPLFSAKRSLKKTMDTYLTEEMHWKRKEEVRIADAKRKADEEALAAATKLADQGKEKEADAVIAQAVAEKPKPVTSVADNSQSFARTKWVAEVVDVKLFLRACADNDNLADFVTIELGKLNRFAQQIKGTAMIPGVQIKEVAAMGAGR